MKKTMRAMVLSRPGPIETQPLELAEVPVQEPGSGQALIKVSACGVCHTDLHIVEGDIHPPALPRIPGHQVVGDVISTGKDSEKWVQPGTRVGIAWLYSADRMCAFCRTGKENLCPQAKFTGFHVDGGYADYMLADSSYLLPIPDSISSEQAAPLLCAGIIGYRSLILADLNPGEKLGLVGFGASAHLSIQVARHWSCAVYVYTRSEEHRRHALELGAVWAGSALDKVNHQLDRAVIFAPSGELVPLILEKIRPGGTLAINAIHMSDLPVMPYRLIYGERTIRSVANATYMDGIEFLKLAESIPVRSTVQSYPLEKTNQALEDMKHSRFNGEAVLMIS
jgi:alcohol dehydrogenase, propanol-preferring